MRLFFSCKKSPNGTVLFNGEQDFMDLPLAIEVQDSIYIDVPGEIERLTTDSPEIYREANSTMIEDGGFNYSSCSSDFSSCPSFCDEGSPIDPDEFPDVEEAAVLSGALELVSQVL